MREQLSSMARSAKSVSRSIPTPVAIHAGVRRAGLMDRVIWSGGLVGEQGFMSVVV